MKDTLQSLTGRLLKALPLADTVQGRHGPLQVEVIDLLQGVSPRAEADMLAVKMACYQTAKHGECDVEVRLRAHVTDAFDVERYDRFNTVCFMRDADGEAIAAGHSHVRLVEIEGQMVELIRASMSVKPGWRGGGLTRMLLHRLMIGYMSVHGISRYPRFYMGYCMHPIMYTIMYRRSRHLFPSPQPTLPILESVYTAIFGQTAGQAIPEQAGSRDSPRSRAWVEANRHLPPVAFYLSRNPNYADGYTLPVIMRTQLRDLAAIMARSVWFGLRER